MAQQSVTKLLRALREDSGKSLRSAAGDLGVVPSHLSRLERGEVSSSAELRARAARYYGVDAELLDLAEGYVPADVARILAEHPELITELRTRFRPGRRRASS